MIRCFDRKCRAQIVFAKPVPRGKTPKGKCSACGKNYIAAYNCNGKLKIIEVD